MEIKELKRNIKSALGYVFMLCIVYLIIFDRHALTVIFGAGCVYFTSLIITRALIEYIKNGKKRKEMANRADGASTDVDGTLR